MIRMQFLMHIKVLREDFSSVINSVLLDLVCYIIKDFVLDTDDRYSKTKCMSKTLSNCSCKIF